MSRRCSHHETLASGPICEIERCRDCKCVSIHLGPTTLRIEESALASLRATIEQALVHMHASSPWLAEPPAPGLPSLPTRGSA